MFQKFFASLVLFLALLLIANFGFKGDGDKLRHEKVLTISGAEEPGHSETQPVGFDSKIEPIVYSDTIWEMYAVRTGPQTIYDFQSNGVPQQIWQDPNNPDNIHATFMVNTTPGWPAADRRCYYVFSSDGGTTWTDYGPIKLSESGFCVCSGLSDGSAVIGMHTSAGTPPVRFQLFADVAPGAGTFTRLDPGLVNSQPALWPRIMPTSSLSNPRKVVSLSSINIGDSSTAFNHALSVTSSYWSGFQGFADAKDAETYSFARANDGRIGCAYVANYTSVPGNLGDVHYIVTTDDGLSWSPPQKIYNAPPYLDGVFGCLRGLSLSFLGTTPKVAFELMGMTPTGFYPNARAAIGYWSPNVNGGAAYVTAFDSSWSQNGNGGATDAYTSICRPSIGKSTGENDLLMVFEVSRPDTDEIGSHYYDVYFSCSTNGGTYWKYPPTRMTNNSGPLRDNRFASISPTNEIRNGFQRMHMVFQMDSIPGSVTQNPAASESFAKQWYVRYNLGLCGHIGIATIGSEIPVSFKLHQNFPNPFNPVTKIRFEIPKSENVTLKVYNATGQLVAILANNEPQSAGLKEVTFNANGLASGIYFYSIQAGEFSASRKMILVK